MKKCYELVFTLSNEYGEHNVIFENKEKAYLGLACFYKIGQNKGNKKITSSKIVERILL